MKEEAVTTPLYWAWTGHLALNFAASGAPVHTQQTMPCLWTVDQKVQTTRLCLQSELDEAGARGGLMGYESRYLRWELRFLKGLGQVAAPVHGV